MGIRADGLAGCFTGLRRCEDGIGGIVKASFISWLAVRDVAGADRRAGFMRSPCVYHAPNGLGFAPARDDTPRL
jgi:hypothetical protein